ncbi:hypothetical protein [Halobacillus campisalis]|uniref:Uncharacterized protein n=1 Tax=Halobacillus campisalis TaxID=435909 RepID=A0ABW2K0L6_9BACI|nr:hypothetical protein [Halobacillus campisalis]
MEFNQKVNNQESQYAPELPSKYIVGFMLCIMLTAFSLWGAVYSSYSPKPLLYAIAAFAFSQAILQLLHVQGKALFKR